MMTKIISILPTQSLIYVLICGAGIIGFIFMIIVPHQNMAAELDRDIEHLNDRIEQQKILRPVFVSLLEKAKREYPTQLPVTKRGKLERGNISQVTELLQDIADRHNLKIQNIQTDVSAMMTNHGFIAMRIHATGDFMKFRDFLVDLGTIPFLAQIEEIIIRAIEQNREYKLKVWMAQK
jgi:hypothetical protein